MYFGSIGTAFPWLRLALGLHRVNTTSAALHSPTTITSIEATLQGPTIRECPRWDGVTKGLVCKGFLMILQHQLGVNVFSQDLPRTVAPTSTGLRTSFGCRVLSLRLRPRVVS